MLINVFSYKIFKTTLNFSYKKELIRIINDAEYDNFLGMCNKNTTNGKIFDFVENDKRFEYKGVNLINVLSLEIEKKLFTFSELININKKLLISNFWCVSYQNNQKCKPHIHKSSDSYVFSGIYYLSFDENEHQGTTFYDDMNLTKSITPSCKENDIIIYPRNIVHGYNGTDSKKTRIVLPFDISYEKREKK